jgi:hypothetical protein
MGNVTHGSRDVIMSYLVDVQGEECRDFAPVFILKVIDFIAQEVVSDGVVLKDEVMASDAAAAVHGV